MTLRQIGKAKTFRKTPPPRTPEELWQREVVGHLRAALHGSVVVHAANERTASQELGMFPGYPDLVIHWRGLTVGVELKAKGRSLRDDQVQCHGRLEANGVPVHVLVEDDRDGLGRIVDGMRAEAHREL